jgi:hypothetical protein
MCTTISASSVQALGVLTHPQLHPQVGAAALEVLEEAQAAEEAEPAKLFPINIKYFR